MFNHLIIFSNKNDSWSIFGFPLPKLWAAERGGGCGGTSPICSYCDKLIAATSLLSIRISCSILLGSHSTSTRISYSDPRLTDFLDSMCTTLTPRSCEKFPQRHHNWRYWPSTKFDSTECVFLKKCDWPTMGLNDVYSVRLNRQYWGPQRRVIQTTMGQLNQVGTHNNIDTVLHLICDSIGTTYKHINTNTDVHKYVVFK